jgi:hypothetical protein
LSCRVRPRPKRAQCRNRIRTRANLDVARRPTPRVDSNNGSIARSAADRRHRRTVRTQNCCSNRAYRMPAAHCLSGQVDSFCSADTCFVIEIDHMKPPMKSPAPGRVWLSDFEKIGAAEARRTSGLRPGTARRAAAPARGGVYLVVLVALRSAILRQRR